MAPAEARMAKGQKRQKLHEISPFFALFAIFAIFAPLRIRKKLCFHRSKLITPSKPV
jgi:hypothetical protein